MGSIARAEWAICQIRERSALRAKLAPRIDETGHFFAEETATAHWWLQLAERFSIGFELSSGEACDFDTWAGVPGARYADWNTRAVTRTGAVVSLHHGEAGVIYDYLDGDDYYDPKARVWWAGRVENVGIWVRIAPAVRIGCQLGPGENTTITSLAIDLPVVGGSNEQGANSPTRGAARE